MATTSPTPAPAPVKETAGQKFQSILTGIGTFIQKVINAEINIAIAEKPLIDQFLPPQISSAIDTAEEVALNAYLQIEAEEQQIGQSNAPYALKVAQVVALQGGAIAKILASAGLSAGQSELTALVTGATSFTQIPLANLTTLQAPAAPAPAVAK